MLAISECKSSGDRDASLDSQSHCMRVLAWIVIGDKKTSRSLMLLVLQFF